MSCKETSKLVFDYLPPPLTTELFLVLKVFKGPPAVESMVICSMESSLNNLPGATETEFYLPWNGF